VWTGSNPALGGTIAVEADPSVDTLGALLSEATLGEYDIYGELGRGGMAAVYLGLDLSLNRKVAIKTMLPELVQREGMVQRFKREAQTSASLSHPHIIQIYAVKQSKSLCYFVMKFVEGRSLESVIHDKGFVPLAMTQTILGQVGSALDFAHKKHVVHRDIKPANIMIDEDGWAIVTDFGIAKVQEAQNLTATGTAIGTPHYMSPEQFHNKAVTGASDQYSLGVVLYEMLAGKKPFDGATYAEIITQHLFEQVPDLREINKDVPSHVIDVVKKMMAKDPKDRFPDLDTAIHALGAPASKKEGDVVRTQMISLAKSGPQKKIRMSVPMSPIPVTKRQAPAAQTVIESKRKPETKKSGAGKWIGIAATLLALAGGGGYYVKFVNPGLLAPKPTVQPAGNPVSGSVPAPPGDSSAASGAAVTTQQAPETTATAAATPPAVDSAKIRADSARAVRQRDARRRDSINIENKRLTAFRDSVRRVADSIRIAAAKPPVIRPTGFAMVKIGSRLQGAYLYINDEIDNQLSSARDVRVPAGAEVKLSIKAQGCPQVVWDTTITVAAGSKTGIGWRPVVPKC
jgi:serine/threonine-protein kinase